MPMAAMTLAANERPFAMPMERPEVAFDGADTIGAEAIVAGPIA